MGKPFPVAARARQGEKEARIMGLRERITWHYSRRLRAHGKNNVEEQDDTRRIKIPAAFMPS